MADGEEGEEGEEEEEKRLVDLRRSSLMASPQVIRRGKSSWRKEGKGQEALSRG